jgi:hypothetical protein
MSVAGSRKHLEDAIIDRKEGNIESTTSEIVDDDLRLATLLVETVSDRGSSRLVNDTEDLKASDCSCVLGSLTLSVVEVWTSRLVKACKLKQTETYRQEQ